MLGQPITYLITVTNRGREPATAVTAHIKLAPEVSFDQTDGIYPGEVTYNRVDHSLTWTLGEISTGQHEIISFTARTTTAGLARQSAVVTSLEPEERPMDNESHSLVEIVALKIPNVFTPNGDGINDSFEIVGLDLVQKCDVTIFNATGNEVYRHTDYRNNADGRGWDGSGLSQGVYFYLIKIQFEDGKSHVFRGNVTILRN